MECKHCYGEEQSLTNSVHRFYAHEDVWVVGTARQGLEKSVGRAGGGGWDMLWFTMTHTGSELEAVSFHVAMRTANEPMNEGGRGRARIRGIYTSMCIFAFGCLVMEAIINYPRTPPIGRVVRREGVGVFPCVGFSTNLCVSFACMYELLV